MLKNYLRIAYRSLLKNQVFSYINVFGLAIGMTAFLFIAQYVTFEKSYEDFHANADNIYRVTIDIYNGSEFVTTDCGTYAPTGPYLKEKLPEVVDFARMYGLNGLISVKAGKANFMEQGMYWADHSVFDIFTYQFIEGDKTKALTAPFEAVLTESMARKYFGKIAVIGESIEIDKKLYNVKGVIADVPYNTHIKFSFLLSRLSLHTLKPHYPDDVWGNNNEFTYVLTTPGTDINTFNRKLRDVSTELRSKIGSDVFIAQPIRDIHLHSNREYEPEPNGNADTVHYLSLIGLFILAIAWVNYINLSTARAVERGREVGIRKVVGSLKSQLIWQFLAESVIMNLIAGAVTLVLFQLSFPLLKHLSGLPISSDSMNNMHFWLLFGLLIISGSLLSGIYPAFVLASFNPVSVLKGKFRSSSHGQLLRKCLVVFQFSATVVLVISMCTVFMQVNFLRNYDLGMKVDQTIVLTGKQIKVLDSLTRPKSAALKSALLGLSDVESVTRAVAMPGTGFAELSTTSVKRFGETSDRNGYQYYYLSVDADFANTLNMTFLAGRNFKEGVVNDDQVIINENAAELLGFANAEDAVGSKITFRTRNGAEGSTVIGVLRNFHFRSPKDGHLPMIFRYDESNEYVAVRLHTSDMSGTIAALEKAWTAVYPDTIFNYYFLDQKYDDQYKSDVQFGSIMAAFSILIVIVACLGLFGLSSYTIVQRTKEIGIRKVLGASVSGIVRLLSKEFARTVFIAAMIAVPIAYYFMNEWLSGYAVRIDLSIWVFTGSIIAIMLLAMITVSFQTIKTASSNPVNSLKQE